MYEMQHGVTDLFLFPRYRGRCVSASGGGANKDSGKLQRSRLPDREVATPVQGGDYPGEAMDEASTVVVRARAAATRKARIRQTEELLPEAEAAAPQEGQLKRVEALIGSQRRRGPEPRGIPAYLAGHMQYVPRVRN